MVDDCIAEFVDDDFMRIWKGLFYCMWMADKLLVQVLETGDDGWNFVDDLMLFIISDTFNTTLYNFKTVCGLVL